MDANFSFGFARANINPKNPVSLAGYFNVRMWDDVLDDLEVRACFFRSNGRISGIIQFDLITTTNALTDAVFAELSKDYPELSMKNVIVTATHTHTGPELRTGKRGGDDSYVGYAAAQAVKAAREALANMTPGECAVTRTSDHRFEFNRRYYMKDGSVITNPGKLNAQIARPEGDVDYEIPLVAFKSQGKIKLLIGSFVNHTDTIGGCKVSADWAGHAHRLVEAELGDNSMFIPLVGASGNINHFDVTTDSNQTCYEESRRIGKGYAETVIQALKELKPAHIGTLRTVSAEVELEPPAISQQEIAEAKQIVEDTKDLPDPTTAKNVELTSEDLARKAPIVLKFFAMSLLDLVKDRAKRTATITGLVADDFCILSLPGEPFVEIGLILRKEIFAGKLALVASHGYGMRIATGGSTSGYIPNRWNYGRGGYETTIRSNPVGPESAERLLNAWRELRKGL